MSTADWSTYVKRAIENPASDRWERRTPIDPEQANLDFTLVYRDAFREAGDEASARVCQLIHDEEVEHVRLAAHWLRELQPGESSDIERYRRSVPFPLSAARAKGRRFDLAGRRDAGLDDDFIEFVRAKFVRDVAADFACLQIGAKIGRAQG